MDPAALGALVCETLSQAGISAVLTGGTCVSVWTRNEFASLDLDFVALGLHSNIEIAHALQAIGIKRGIGNPRYFQHPDIDLALEFPPGPLMVGDEHVPNINVDRYATDLGILRLLSPTDCVKDRLAELEWGGPRDVGPPSATFRLGVDRRAPMSDSKLKKVKKFSWWSSLK